MDYGGWANRGPVEGRARGLCASQEEPYRLRMPGDGGRPELAGRQLDDERRGSRKPVVLPVRARPVRPADGAIRLARQARVAPRLLAAPAPRADERLRLVVPDRSRRAGRGAPAAARAASRARTTAAARSTPDPSDFRCGIHSEPKLRLRSTPRPFRRMPSRRPSGLRLWTIQRSSPVGRCPCAQPLGDVDPLALVSVDAAEDEDLARAREVAEAVNADRAPPLGVPEDAVSSTRRRWPLRQRSEETRP